MEEHQEAQAKLSENYKVDNGSLEDNKSDELEMKTLEKTQKFDNAFKIVCGGDYTGGCGTAGIYVADCIHERSLDHQRPIIGVDFYQFLKWKDSVKKKEFSIALQFWAVAEQERFSTMTRLYFRNSDGALVFCGPKIPSTLNSTLKWSQKIQEVNKPNLPMVLIVENIPSSKQEKPTEWIGPGKMVESREALDQFCVENGFLGWFELHSRQGEGYNGVMKQAINCLVHNIFENTNMQDS